MWGLEIITERGEHTRLYHVLMLCVAIIGKRINGYTPARREESDYLKVTRIHEPHKIAS